MSAQQKITRSCRYYLDPSWGGCFGCQQACTAITSQTGQVCILSPKNAIITLIIIAKYYYSDCDCDHHYHYSYCYHDMNALIVVILVVVAVFVSIVIVILLSLFSSLLLFVITTILSLLPLSLLLSLLLLSLLLFCHCYYIAITTFVITTILSLLLSSMGGKVHLQVAAEGVLAAGGLPQGQSASLLSLLLRLLHSSKLRWGAKPTCRLLLGGCCLHEGSPRTSLPHCQLASQIQSALFAVRQQGLCTSFVYSQRPAYDICCGHVLKQASHYLGVGVWGSSGPLGRPSLCLHESRECTDHAQRYR